MHEGILFIISAPSGAGKSSLIQSLLKIKPLLNIKLSISHTTRTIRSGEYHGEHYYFIKDHQFRSMINKKKFLEYAKVFGNYYGTSHQNVTNILQQGFDLLLDIDWQGARAIRKVMPKSKSIFILPPSKKELQRRLCQRNQDTQFIISQRMAQAMTEISHYVEYDYLIINQKFDDALIDLQTIIKSERLRLNRQKVRAKTLINKLLTV
ncbi:guanylate kinase [Candidatus Erwinia haradaeae]|uniref:Guanylate kinase n=1 Tax=Candidatus Erwinia haradaeae TaxID=1922217 RepID=A0A451D8W9_9GAMM|nr:guanylate kinase [Candidatus Erwinia haradaeae]VFP82258.1 Guanylate kinase [Candidatus Erwinia haradaeae]